MSTHSVVEAKNQLSDLIDRAQHGESVVITRHGTPVAELRAIPPAPRPLGKADMDWLAARRVARRKASEDAGTLVSRGRDEEQR